MSITNITTNLQKLNPCYNPLVYSFDSTNKNKTGFRYTVDVYSAGTATKLCSTLKIAPRPVDGYGYVDLSKILSNYLTWDVTLTNTSTLAIPNSFINYDVKIGEEYIFEWLFDDTQFYSGDTKLINTGATQAHTFVTGDQVTITQDTQYIPLLEGLQIVDDVPDAYSFSVQIPFINSVPNSGSVKYADNSPTIFPNLLTYSANTAWNGALSFEDWIDYDAVDYTLSAATGDKLLLTNLPSNFYATQTQDIWINYAHRKSSNAFYVYFENSNGDIFRKTINNTTQNLRQFSAGPNNAGTLTLISGTTGLVKSDTTYYDFWVTTSAASAVTQTYRINIDNRCKIENYEIVFQDRLGSFVSFAFPLRNQINGNITRQSYNQQMGNISGGKWTMNTSDAGEVITDVSVSKEYTLNTNWITQEMSDYFEELYTSPVTWLKIGTKYFRCTVQDNGFPIQSPNNKKIISRSVRVKLAAENIINI